MDLAFMLGHLDPANRYAMEGLNMAFMAELHRDGKPLPKLLFIDIMVEKTQKLIEHINHHHLRLSLTANIGENSAVIKMYDNYATVNSQLLYVTILNLWDFGKPIMETVDWGEWCNTWLYPPPWRYPSFRHTYQGFLNPYILYNYCIYICLKCFMIHKSFNIL